MRRRASLAPLALAALLASSRAGADEVWRPTPATPVAPAHGPAESQLSLKLSLGGDYRDLVGVPVYAGDANLSIGARIGLYAVYGTIGVTAGATKEGLTTSIYAIGCSFERRFDPFTLGLGFRPSYLRINRITSGSALDSLGVGVAPFVSFDVVSWEEHVLFLSASVNLDEYVSGGSVFAWGPTLSIGYREH